MAEAYLSFFLIVAVGIVARQSIRKTIDPDALRHAVNTTVLYVLVPAFLLAAVWRIDVETLEWQMPAVMGAGVLGSVFVGMFAFGFFNIDQRTKGSLILSCAFGNVACFYPPLFAVIFDDGDAEGLPLTRAAMIACTVVAGGVLAGWYGAAGKNSFAFVRSVGGLLRLPPFWALVAGGALKFYEVEIPLWVLDGADLLSVGITGLLILSVGLALRLPKTNEIGPVLPAVAIKLIVSPVLLYLLIEALGSSADSGLGASVVITGALPTQLLVLAIAERFKLDCAVVALVFVVNTALSFWTMPFIHGLLY